MQDLDKFAREIVAAPLTILNPEPQPFETSYPGSPKTHLARGAGTRKRQNERLTYVLGVSQDLDKFSREIVACSLKIPNLFRVKHEYAERRY